MGVVGYGIVMYVGFEDNGAILVDVCIDLWIWVFVDAKPAFRFHSLHVRILGVYAQTSRYIELTRVRMSLAPCDITCS